MVTLRGIQRIALLSIVVATSASDTIGAAGDGLTKLRAAVKTVGKVAADRLLAYRGIGTVVSRLGGVQHFDGGCGVTGSVPR